MWQISHQEILFKGWVEVLKRHYYFGVLEANFTDASSIFVYFHFDRWPSAMAHLAYKNKIFIHFVTKSEFIIGFSVVDLVEKCLIYWCSLDLVFFRRLKSEKRVPTTNFSKQLDYRIFRPSSTTLNPMVNSDLVTSGGVTIHIFIFVSYQ